MAPNSSTNVQHIRDALDSARRRIDEFCVDFSLREFWANVRAVNELLKTLSPLPSSARHAFRSELNELCEKAKTIRGRQDDDSRIKREMVEGKIADAARYVHGGCEVELRTARGLLNEALEWMKNGWSGFNISTQLTSFSSGKMNRQDHDTCWKLWQEANEAIRSRYFDLSVSNYDWLHAEAMEASGYAESEPARAKEQVKSIQRKMRGRTMAPECFQEIHRILDRIWERANDTGRRKHEEWERKQEEWRERARGRIARKRELIEEGEALISRLEDQIDHCRDLEANARTHEYAEQVRGWIEEKTEIIESKRRFIQEVEDQLRDLEGKLSE